MFGYLSMKYSTDSKLTSSLFWMSSTLHVSATKPYAKNKIIMIMMTLEPTGLFFFSNRWKMMTLCSFQKSIFSVRTYHTNPKSHIFAEWWLRLLSISLRCCMLIEVTCMCLLVNVTIIHSEKIDMNLPPLQSQLVLV